MRNRKKRQRHISLESELKRLSAEKIKRDPRNRTRAELLAATLWSKSLAGDGNALKLLLERLPISTPQAEAEPTASKPDGATEGTKMDHVINLMRALVQHGIMPAEVFSKYELKRELKQFDEKYQDEPTTKIIQ